jgi:hypothetical protein
LNEEFVLETHTRLRREIPLLVGILVDEFFFHVVTVGVMWESKLMMAALGRIHDNAGSGISEIEAIRVGLSLFRV